MKKMLVVGTLLFLPFLSHAEINWRLFKQFELSPKVLAQMERAKAARQSYNRMLEGVTLRTLGKNAKNPIAINSLELIKNAINNPDKMLADVARASWIHDSSNPYIKLDDLRALFIMDLYLPSSTEEFVKLAPGETLSVDKAPFVTAQRDFYVLRARRRPNGTVKQEKLWLPKGSTFRLDDTFGRENFDINSWESYVKTTIQGIVKRGKELTEARGAATKTFMGRKLSLVGDDVLKLMFSENAGEFFGEPILINHTGKPRLAVPINTYPLTIDGQTYTSPTYVELYVDAVGTLRYDVTKNLYTPDAFDEEELAEYLNPDWFDLYTAQDGTDLYVPKHPLLFRYTGTDNIYVAGHSDAFVKSQYRDLDLDPYGGATLVTSAMTLGEYREAFPSNEVYPVVVPSALPEENPIRLVPTKTMEGKLRSKKTSLPVAPSVIDLNNLESTSHTFKYLAPGNVKQRFYRLARVKKSFTLPDGRTVNEGDYIEMNGPQGPVLVFTAQEVQETFELIPVRGPGPLKHF